MALSPDLWDFVGRLLDVVDERYKGDRLLRIDIATELCRCLNLTDKERDNLALAERFWHQGHDSDKFDRVLLELHHKKFDFQQRGLVDSADAHTNFLLLFCFAGYGGMEDENGDYIIASASGAGLSDDVIKSVVCKHIPELRDQPDGHSFPAP